MPNDVTLLQHLLCFYRELIQNTPVTAIVHLNKGNAICGIKGNVIE